MKKTSVYLSDEEVEGLRRVSSATGRSQAELIRAGIEHVLESEGSHERVFRSMGLGQGSGQATPRWDPDELYGAVMGER